MNLVDAFKQLFVAVMEYLFRKDAPPQTNLTKLKEVKMNMDYGRFQLALAKHLGKLYKSTQATGFELISKKYFEGAADARHLAYILATALHETAFTMKPITEYGTMVYLQGKKYWPYIGRGYVQLTWAYNYEKYGIKNSPEKALEPDRAAYIIVDGMEKGIFTGKKLSDYFNSTASDAINARRIVNGTDKAQAIAGYYAMILQAIQESLDTAPTESPMVYGNDDTFVRAFQNKFGLVVDGIPGKKTWEKLKSLTTT